MTKTSKYSSRILEAVHEGVCDLFVHGSIDAEAMKKFDELCLNELQAIHIENRNEDGEGKPIH